MSSDHSPNSLTKEAGKASTQTLRPPRKNPESVAAVDPWQLLALRTCIYIRTMQIKNHFSLPQEATRGWRSRPSSWWPSSLLILDKVCLLTLWLGLKHRSLCRYLGWGLHVKAQISAAKEENYYKYVDHGENEKRNGQKTQSPTLERQVAVFRHQPDFADFNMVVLDI